MNLSLSTLSGDELKVAALERIYLQNRDNPRFVSETISLMGQLDEEIAWRALWLVRRAAQDGPLPIHDLDRVAELADASRHWAWRLLMCQLFGVAVCPAGSRQEFFPFLESCFTDRRVIIRAWALSAMWQFRADPEFKTGISRYLRIARRDPGKAMQARLRLLTAAQRKFRPVEMSRLRST